MLDQPPADVGEVLGRVLQPVDVGHGLEGWPARGLDAEQVGEDPVQRDVVAPERVRAERVRAPACVDRSIRDVANVSGECPLATARDRSRCVQVRL